MELLIPTFWAWWGLIVAWSVILFGVGLFVENRDVAVRGATLIVLCIFAAMVMGSMEWLHYMQVWPFVPQ